MIWAGILLPGHVISTVMIEIFIDVFTTSNFHIIGSIDYPWIDNAVI